jgi:hypothetical protein
MTLDRCREFEAGVRERVYLGMDQDAFMSWLADFSDVETCVCDGLRRARHEDDWLMFEKYVIVAFWRPSSLYTNELCEVLRGRPEGINVEDIVDTLGEIRDPASIGCLEEVIWWEPEWDEYRHLAVKAVWALAAIGTPEALAVLRDSVSSEAEPIREAAAQELKRVGG